MPYLPHYISSPLSYVLQSFTSLMQCYFLSSSLLPLLSLSSSPTHTGVLITWFIEDGAGVEYKFKLQTSKLNDDNYCDVKRLNEFLGGLGDEQAGPIVSQIFNPLHILFAQRRNDTKGDLAKRIKALEGTIAKVCETHKKWLFAYKVTHTHTLLSLLSSSPHTHSPSFSSSFSPLFRHSLHTHTPVVHPPGRNEKDLRHPRGVVGRGLPY
jgi:hypothetical protein